MKYLTAIIFALAIIIAAFFLGNAYVKRAQPAYTISVTGNGSENFTSDLIVWEGSFTTSDFEMKLAFEQLNRDKELVRDYLITKGIKAADIIFSSVQTLEKQDNIYDNGNFVGTTFKGYQLLQSIQIESTDVPMIEQLSREITELLNKGVQLNSSPPRYYYTGLADLKIEMISKATEDARMRAEKIASNAGGELGGLISAQMGVFQITGQNSGESFSWDGVYNTASKNKNASITMRLEYEVEP